MKNLLILICFILSNYSCQTEKKDTHSCFSKIEKEIFITQLLSNDRVSNYLHLDIIERIPLKLKESKLITKNLNIFIKNEKIIVINNDSITDLITLKFSKIDCKKSELKFSIFFKIENALIEGKARKMNKNKWLIEMTKEIEY
ncbi:hypothetical protein Lupro_02950 [Lutibacter profundi]|uniref:Uncharacterized protein n=1 Tax=Lutibacter profundi TaxID=1622118 RepID=A0A0X8G591_9FLAO|nr:hypothetical protein [Lutibacter profundi]AMC10275.1 hypothetical protein Lupro_02950 [Lutibacter profundi]